MAKLKIVIEGEIPFIFHAFGGKVQYVVLVNMTWEGRNNPFANEINITYQLSSILKTLMCFVPLFSWYSYKLQSNLVIIDH